MKKETNYRSWSFRLLVYVLLLNAVTMYLTIKFTPLVHDSERFYIRMLLLSVLALILFITGVILTVLSVNNKEDKDYKYKISIYGYPIFFIVSVLASFL